MGFRGTGGVYNQEHPHYDKPALIRAGHIGLAGIIEGKIIGFSPTPESAEKAGGEKELLEKLRNHEAVPGCLQDDTAIFRQAYEMAQKGENTIVWMIEIEVSQETVEKIRDWYETGKESLYNFPEFDGSFKPGEYNCATFPVLMGISIPANTGILRTYIAEMSRKGKKWTGEI